MADSMDEQYDIQVISSRYIRRITLENYVNSKIDEFGTEWKCQTARNNKIVFTALRKLTPDELDHLQRSSYSDRAPQTQSLFA